MHKINIRLTDWPATQNEAVRHVTEATNVARLKWADIVIFCMSHGNKYGQWTVSNDNQSKRLECVKWQSKSQRKRCAIQCDIFDMLHLYTFLPDNLSERWTCLHVGQKTTKMGLLVQVACSCNPWLTQEDWKSTNVFALCINLCSKCTNTIALLMCSKALHNTT